MKEIYHHWYCPAPAELNSQGGAGPPVLPEVIVVLLILRRLWLKDAPSEHFFARELCYGGKLSTSILFIPVDGSTREVSSEGKYKLP